MSTRMHVLNGNLNIILPHFRAFSVCSFAVERVPQSSYSPLQERLAAYTYTYLSNQLTPLMWPFQWFLVNIVIYKAQEGITHSLPAVNVVYAYPGLSGKRDGASVTNQV